MKFKLGRKAVKRDSRTLRLGRYMLPALAAPPASADWTTGISQWGMMLNDQLGCCTIAGVGHAIQVMTAAIGKEVTLPDATIQAYYESWDGYDPNDPSTDQGGIEADVLKNWKKKGFGGHGLTAFADVSVSDLTEIEQAINLFGGVYIGTTVTDQVMATSDDPSKPWDVTAGDKIDGGHAVFVPKYDADYFYLISWGQIYKMTRAYWAKYVDEAHALLSPDFIAASGLDPQGFNLAQLEADLAAIV